MNDNFNPSWPLDDVDAPSISPISDDDDSSIGSEDSSMDSADCGPCGAAPEGPPAPTEDVASPPRNQAPAPPRRSKRLKGEKPEFKSYLAAHPDYARCNTSLVTDRMRNKGFIQANKAQFVCTLGKKQPPRSARLSRKKKEYKSTLTSTKLQEASKDLGALDWEVPSADALLEK